MWQHARRLDACLIALLLLAAAPRASAEVRYVDDSATGANDGSTWCDAFTEFQSALAVATAGDEIRVAAGTYLPDYDPAAGQHTGDRDATLQLISTPGVDPTNNLVEQALRFVTIDRHITQGTRRPPPAPGPNASGPYSSPAPNKAALPSTSSAKPSRPTSLAALCRLFSDFFDRHAVNGYRRSNWLKPWASTPR